MRQFSGCLNPTLLSCNTREDLFFISTGPPSLTLVAMSYVEKAHHTVFVKMIEDFSCRSFTYITNSLITSMLCERMLVDIFFYDFFLFAGIFGCNNTTDCTTYY